MSVCRLPCVRRHITSAIRKSMNVSVCLCVCDVDRLSHLGECLLINPGRVLIQEMETD